MDDIGKKLGITNQEKWYLITASVLKQHGGGTLLFGKYNGSPASLLTHVYPEYHFVMLFNCYLHELIYAWDILKFHSSDSGDDYKSLPHSHWDTISNQRTFLENLARKLNIKDHEGWYRITKTALRQYGGSTLLKGYGNIPSRLLASVFPEYHCIK